MTCGEVSDRKIVQVHLRGCDVPAWGSQHGCQPPIADGQKPPFFGGGMYLYLRGQRNTITRGLPLKSLTFTLSAPPLLGLCCSSQHGIDMFADLINKTGKYAVIENCNNGPKPTTPVAEGGCPHYHQYRTSGDINNGYPSWVSNAQTVAHYATSGLSGPTCWACEYTALLDGQCREPLSRAIVGWG